MTEPERVGVGSAGLQGVRCSKVNAKEAGSWKRRWLAMAAKCLVAVLILWLLIREVDVEILMRTLAKTSVPLLVLGVLLNVSTVLIAGLRWKLLIRAAGLPLRWRDLTCIAFIGQFFATFLPGPIGDDLTRMVYVARIAGDKTPVALSSVVLDRIIGLSVILMLALLVSPWHYDLLAANTQTALFAGGLFVGGIVVAAALALFFLVPRGWLHSLGALLMRLLPTGHWRLQLGRFVGAYVEHRRTIVLVLAAAFATQVVLCVLFWTAGAAVGISLGAAVWFGFVPVVLAANALPVTVAGLGIREYLVVLFLGVLGNVPQELALAASLAAFAMMLTTNLLGGVVFLAYRSKISPAAARSCSTTSE